MKNQRIFTDEFLNNENQKLEDHVQRLIMERNDRVKQFLDLEKFIQLSPIFKALDDTKQILLRKQFVIMGEFINILNDRIVYEINGIRPNKTEGETFIGTFGNDRDDIFDLKFTAARYIDSLHYHGKVGRRMAKAKTDAETSCMYAVKSLFD